MILKEANMALFCTSCGTALPAGARFCSSCGASVAATGYTSSRPTVRPHVGRVIAGVCIGLAQAYGWDVNTVRILTVIGFFFSGGIVAVAYIACWIGLPEEPFAAPGNYSQPPASQPPA